ncbi:MAG: ABC transporter ATP-binding protein [Chloroflexota bacterium]|nr:MAG: ABC transporter ATP-binding protein [Chloroflexota bacterium]
MSAPILELRHLTRVYTMGRSEVRALDGVDLTINRGEFLAIVGRSGSGKSTLLNLLGCLDRPTQGTIILDGEDVTRVPKNRLPLIRRGKIGFVFQQFNLVPTLTALENIMLPLKYARVPAHERKARALKILEKVELGGRSGHRPNELSGGEQQRVTIARALVNEPAIVLADEPTGELDSHLALAIIDMMRDIGRESGQTFIVVTHDPMVANETDRIIRLQDGKILSDHQVTAEDRLRNGFQSA